MDYSEFRINRAVPTKTVCTFEYGEEIVVVKNVPCDVDEVSGEKHFTNEVLTRVQKHADRATRVNAEFVLIDYEKL